MLTLILGTDWVANRNEILTRIAADVRCRKPGRVLMVPELISHEMERKLCEFAGDTASRYAEVLSFTRLARRMAEKVGAGAIQCLDNGGRIVAMAAAARQLKNVLKVYASVETRPEFLSAMVDAVDEFKRCCIQSADLLSASKQTEGVFAQKLEELSLLLDAYDGLCAHGKRDPRDQMTWLLEQLEDGEYASEHVFYIDGFPDFTRQNFAIIEQFLRSGTDVTVSLNCDVPNSTAMAFEKAGATAADLMRCAQKLDVKVSIHRVDGRVCPMQDALPGLFQGATSRCGAVRVLPAVSVHAECMAAADRIRKLVAGGCRYRDISVVCADMTTYQYPLNLIFRRCGIPVYQSGKEDILDKTVIHTVLSALDSALGGFDRTDVMQYLKSALSPLEADLCCKIDNYTYIWNIQANRWLEPWQYHPDGLGAPWTEDAYERLAELEQARQEIVAPLVHLRDSFRKANRVADQLEGLAAFFRQIELAQRLGMLADEMEQKQEPRNAQILNQLWEILLTAMEQLYDVLGSTVWDTETFVKLFTLLLSQYDVGTIPPVLDAVPVGPVNAMRCQEVEHLIVLGAQEGSLPGYGGSDGILTDQERETLRKLGVPLTGGGMEGLQAEFADIYGVFCGATRSVQVSYSGAQPSFVCRRLTAMAGGELPDATGDEILNSLDAVVALVEQDDEVGAHKLGLEESFRQIKSRKNHTLGKINAEGVKGLYGKQLRLSASQTDSIAQCRFSYFLKYGIGAKERKEAEIDPAEFGTYVHAVLEKTARAVMEMGGFHTVTLEQTAQLAKEYSDDYIAQRFGQLESERMTYLFRRNLSELNMVVAELWAELHTSEFEPVDFELAFGDGMKMPAIQIDNARLPAKLRGFVDRVDAWRENSNTYFRVVDYKTGQKDFDYCDVFNGIGLQMLLYLFALAGGGEDVLGEHTIPVGVQYFPARSPFLAAGGRLTPEEAEQERIKNWKRKGLLLKDEDVLRAMQPEDAPNRLCCKWNKDGEVSGDLADREQLALLKDYVFHVLAKLVDQIASGEVAPNPYSRGSAYSACTYCPYKEVCHYATVTDRRNYKTMSSQKFWESIGKELGNRG